MAFFSCLFVAIFTQHYFGYFNLSVFGYFRLTLTVLSLCGLHSRPLGVRCDHQSAVLAGDGDIIPDIEAQLFQPHTLQHDRGCFLILIA